MVELCSNCNKPLRAGSKFCGFCGTPVKAERRCKKCNELLEYGEMFCPMCGERYEEAAHVSPALSHTVQEEKPMTAGTLVDVYDAQTLRFLRGTSDDVKKAVRALKKEVKYAYKWCEGLFLYNKDEQVAFLRRGESPCIEAYSYEDTQVPLCKYTVPNEVDYIWQHTSYAQRFAYFFHNMDAFFAWDDYIFLSVYEGKLAWTAADSRDTYYLPNKKADETIYRPGAPELEFLSNGNIRSEHFYNNAECRYVKGALIPI